MKSLIKFSRSVYADSQTLNAMFLGYLVLVLVAGSFIAKDVNWAPAKEETVIINNKANSVTVHQAKYPTSLYTE